MKSGLAAAMIAMEVLKKIENQLKGKVLFTAVVDEEGPYGLGTDALIRDGITDKCDMTIVTEPAAAFAPKDIHNTCLLIGARGRYLYDIRVKGKAAHGSMPYLGVNAVVDASKIVLELQKMKLGSHPFLGERNTFYYSFYRTTLKRYLAICSLRYYRINYNSCFPKYHTLFT